MKNWINKNYKTIIITAFLVPIITVAVVSISHVSMWYGLSNPFTWAIYLSIGIEIAALSALAAISADMGSKVYFPFSIVTLIQFIGNIFFAYSFIDINSQMFKDWVDLVSPLVYYLGVEPTDFVGHKRFLAFFAGGMLPVISLSFLHMLVKFTEDDRKNRTDDLDKKVDASDIVSEVSRLRLSEEDLKKLEEVLLNPPLPNDALIKAAEKYKKFTEEEILKQAEEIRLKRVFEQAEKIKEQREEEFGPDDLENEPTALANSEYRESDIEKEKSIFPDEVEYNEEYNRPVYPTREEREKLLSEMMHGDEELGLYDEETIINSGDDIVNDAPEIIEDTYNIAQSISDNDVVPALSDEEVKEMFMDEWERRFDLVEEEEEEEEELSIIEPTKEEEEQNFSNITPISENIFQEEAPKFNIDGSYSVDLTNVIDEDEELDNSFWRDHLNDESNEDLKKK